MDKTDENGFDLTTDALNSMFDENYKKASALNQLLADIKAGLVRIVPVEATEKMCRGLDILGPQDDVINCSKYRRIVQHAPAYEPLKDWL